MRNFIVKNVQIFQTWIVYIVFRKQVSKYALDMMDTYYQDGTREKKMLARIRKINQNK